MQGWASYLWSENTLPNASESPNAQSAEIVFEEELPVDMERVVEVVYRWQEPRSSVDEIVYKRLIKIQSERLGCYYYSMYARSKDDILVEGGHSLKSWDPERILMGGKDIAPAVYKGLIELGQSDKYRFIYYQQTPFGLLKLGQIRPLSGDFEPDIKFVRCIASEVGRETPPILWHIGALLSGSLALFDYLNPEYDNKNRAPVADFLTIPVTGTVDTVFYFDAGVSSDPDEPDSSGLLIRWNLDGDGEWDGPFVFDKITSTLFSVPGVYDIAVQARDRAGSFSAVITKTVTVLELGANLGSTPHPMFRNDLHHAGVSPYNGPVVTDTKWAALTGDRIEASPAIASDGTVYIGSYDGCLYALSPIDGGVIWDSPLAGPVHSSAAVAANGIIYVGAGSCLYAINSADGTPYWFYETDGLVRSSPAIDDDGTVYIGSLDNRLYAVNHDGSFKWSVATGGQIWSSPAVSADGTIYAGSLDGRLYAIGRNSIVKWSYAAGGGIYGSPAIGSDGTVYFGGWDGVFYAINSDGSLKWSFPVGGQIWSSPALSGGNVIFGADDGTLYCLDDADGSAQWSFSAGGRVRSSPTVDAAGRIYFGADDGKFYGLSDSGVVLSAAWPIELSGAITPVRSTAAIANAVTPTLYVGSFDRILYAIGSAVLDPADVVIRKTANKQQVLIGDVVTYQLVIINQGPDPTSGIVTTIIDEIPPGFKFLSGSTRLSGALQPDPAGSGGGLLVFDVGHFASGASKTLAYQLVVGSGVVPAGRFVNRARARYFYDAPPLTEAFSPEVQCQVWVVPDPLFDLGTIIGKVFWDKNGNGVQDADETGYGSVEIVMEDGTLVVADKNGNFHIPGVWPGTHLLHLKGVPTSWITTDSPCLARVSPGLLVKRNFGVKPIDGECLDSPFSFFSDMTFVMLGEGKIDSISTRGSNARRQDSAVEGGSRLNGRIAYFLSGKVSDKFAVVSSLDTGRSAGDSQAGDGLARYIEPDKSYNEYGDDSTVSFNAVNGAGPFYLRVDSLPGANWGRSSLLYGSYSSGVGSAGPELASYQRTLLGMKIDVIQAPVYSDGRLFFKASGTVFAAQPDSSARVSHAPARNEFRATGGSIYYLNRRDVLPGSERVMIETRDRVNNMALESRILKRDVDYEIDYAGGRIIFRRPPELATVDNNITANNLLWGNFVYVAVDYEYLSGDGGAISGPYGARLSGELSDDQNNRIQLGGTYVSEGDETGYELKGLDFSLSGPAELLAPVRLSLSAEYAESESRGIDGYISGDGGLGFNTVVGSTGSSGTAYKIKAGINKDERLVLDSYYQEMEAGFVSSASYNHQGSFRYGGSAQYIFSEALRVNLRYDNQELLKSASVASQGNIGAEKTETGILQGVYRSVAWTFTNEYRYQESGGRIAGVKSELNEDLFLGALKADYGFGPGGNLYFIQRNSLQGETNAQSSMGVNFRAGENISARIQAASGTEGRSFLAGINNRVSDKTDVFSSISVGDDGASDVLRSSSGASHRLTPDTRINAQQDYASIDNRKSEAVQRSTSATLGQETRLSEFWRFWSSVQQGLVHDFNGTVDIETVRQAGSIRVRYENGDWMVFDSKIEARFDEGDLDRRQYLTINSFRHRLNEDITISIRENYSRTENRTTSKTEALYNETGLGLALRPVKWDRWHLLLKYKHLRDIYPAPQTEAVIAPVKSVAHIYALETAYDLSQSLQLVEKYAIKETIEKVSGFDECENKTSLWITRINYNVIKKWYAGAEYRILRQVLGDDRKSGFLIEAMRRTGQNIQLGTGYNFTDFSDDLRRNNDYSAGGFFIRVNAIVEY